MVETSIENYEKLWSRGIVPHITEKVVEGVMKVKPGTIYEEPNFPKNSKEALRMLVAPNAHWRSLSDSKKQNIIFTIQDVLDAMRDRDTINWYNGGNELPRKYWFQLAKMLGLKVPEDTSATELSRLVLEKI